MICFYIICSELSMGMFKVNTVFFAFFQGLNNRKGLNGIRKHLIPVLKLRGKLGFFNNIKY